MTEEQNGLKGRIFVCVVHGHYLSFCFLLLVILKRDFLCFIRILCYLGRMVNTAGTVVVTDKSV